MLHVETTEVRPQELGVQAHVVGVDEDDALLPDDDGDAEKVVLGSMEESEAQHRCAIVEKLHLVGELFQGLWLCAGIGLEGAYLGPGALRDVGVPESLSPTDSHLGVLWI